MNTQESKRGLRQYLYEYMFHRMVDDAREQAGDAGRVLGAHEHLELRRARGFAARLAVDERGHALGQTRLHQPAGVREGRLHARHHFRFRQGLLCVVRSHLPQ